MDNRIVEKYHPYSSDGDDTWVYYRVQNISELYDDIVTLNTTPMDELSYDSNSADIYMYDSSMSVHGSDLFGLAGTSYDDITRHKDLVLAKMGIKSVFYE